MAVATENPQIEDAGSVLGPQEPCILFVDDDPLLVSSMQRCFHPYNVRLEVAFHGMQGLINAVDVRPDVIVTDLYMPFASGDEFIARLARHPSTHGVPIIVVTGKSGAVLTSRLRRLGVKRVLSKPLRFGELLTELQLFVPILPRS